ncbi:hypothetical protein FBUS_10981 [Fasciolopsis buskii]|uniref:Uncharacterized protein n=1 Tax=Fasciolopsis buskii TaxID=27845 RepID=A0A8E0VJA8_9TREM|nr:hypothetical protein FBUS_10981 [Fasciolopsis buski]
MYLVHSNWLVDSERVWWPRTITFAQYQRLLLHGDELPNDTPIYDFTEVYRSGFPLKCRRTPFFIKPAVSRRNLLESPAQSPKPHGSVPDINLVSSK